MKNGPSLTNSIISDHNRRRLGNVINEARRYGMVTPELLMVLETKLAFAEWVTPLELPDDVVTMNSKFRLRDLNTGELLTFVLCYPDSVRLSHNISVLEPIGCAILGCHVGDEIAVKSSSGVRRLRLVEVLY